MKIEHRCLRWETWLRNKWLAVVIFAVTLPSFYWIVNDRHVWPWDPAWYGEVSVDLWFKFGHFSKWGPAMLSAFGTKAPGIAWFGQFFVPLGRAMGSIETGLLCSVLAAQIGSLVLASKIAEEFAPGRRLVACVSVLVFASAPLFVAMSHQYFVEPLQLFGVAYFYFLAARGHRMQRVTLLGNLLIATSIALLAKSTSPIYCALPGLIATHALFLKREPGVEASPKGVFLGWICVSAGLILCAVCATFYLKHLQELRGYVSIAMNLEFTANYGRRGTFLQKLPFWLHALHWDFESSWVIAGQLILFGVGMGVSKMRADRQNVLDEARRTRLNLLAISSVIHILTVISLCSLNYSEEIRYLLPLLPAIAVVNIWLVCRIRQPWLVAGVVLLLSFQWIAVCSQALGWGQFGGRNCFWLLPFDRDRKPATEIVRIVRHTANLAGSPRINIVGIELPWLNGNTLSFYSAKEKLITHQRCDYVSLGYAAKDLNAAWGRMIELKPGYFISLEEAAQLANPDFLNVISVAALRRIRDDPDFVPEPFASDLNVVLFRRKIKAPASGSGAPAQ